MSGRTAGSRLLAPAALAVLLVAGWFLYLPALSGGFALDDRANLGGLAAVDDRQSALRFVFSGQAGPLGRPLALASFLPQADAWEEGAKSFLAVNVLIHLLNAVLVAGLLLMLARRLPALEGGSARFAALAATATWLFMPILASASLMVVQRMTTLSATFVLAGLIAYLAARALSRERPAAALAGMTAALVVATLLAVLVKENGALLPTYVLVIEATLLAAPAGIAAATWRNWRLAVLVLPTLAILAYLALRVPYAEATVLVRDFSGFERLLSEARILWIYLAKAFLPLPGTVSPVNDVYPVARSLWQPATLLAVASWALLIALAVGRRRRYPLAAFAILWFVAGHLVESTVLPLDLYFDHRNYLPLIGPVFAGCAALCTLPEGLRKVAYAGLPAYAAFLAAMLYLLTSLWGQPAAAARYWYEQHPGSVRAATRHITAQLEGEGVGAALETLHRFVAREPQHGYLLIQDLNIRCRLAPGEDHSARVADLRQRLGTVAFTHTAGTMLSELANVAAGRGCVSIDPPTLRALAGALRDNPRYRGERLYNALHHKLLALTWRVEGNTDKVIEHLAESEQYAPQGDTTMLRVMTLAQGGRFDAARQAIAEAREEGPRHPVRQSLWQSDLDDLEHYVAALVDRDAAATESNEQ